MNEVIKSRVQRTDRSPGYSSILAYPQNTYFCFCFSFPVMQTQVVTEKAFSQIFKHFLIEIVDLTLTFKS